MTVPQKSDLKVCMYLQCNELKNKRYFEKAARIIQHSDIDLLVFPEGCFIPGFEPFNDFDLLQDSNRKIIVDDCLHLSKNLRCAVVVSLIDRYGTPYSVYANSEAVDNETAFSIYIKHTAAESSALDISNYQDLVKNGLFEPVLFHGFRIGMTICYDCNHAIFSRMYQLNGGVDIIVNSTGGNVVYDKWYKFNKCRAIENSCYELVTMGGDGTGKNPNCYVYGFNSNGGKLAPMNLNGPSDI